MVNTNKQFNASLVSTDQELRQILQLQQQNLSGNLSGEQQKEQGFLTLKHTLPVLQQMHRLGASVIVKQYDQLAGYALTMMPGCREIIPELAPMYSLIGQLQWDDRPVASLNYYVMGQICVGAAFRGQGVFEMLYHFHRQSWSGRFDLLVTEIATRNHRSLRAHEKVGFKIIHTHRDELDEWAVVGWNWK